MVDEKQIFYASFLALDEFCSRFMRRASNLMMTNGFDNTLTALSFNVGVLRLFYPEPFLSLFGLMKAMTGDEI